MRPPNAGSSVALFVRMLARPLTERMFGGTSVHTVGALRFPPLLFDHDRAAPDLDVAHKRGELSDRRIAMCLDAGVSGADKLG